MLIVEDFLLLIVDNGTTLMTGRKTINQLIHKSFLNMKHSAARNVIERCIGVLKNRWVILRSPSFYLIKTQNKRIMACYLLHNFIRREMPCDPFKEALDAVNEVESLGGSMITSIKTSKE